MGLIEQLQSEWPVIQQAPLTFVLLAVAAAALAWATSSWLHRNQIGDLKERIGLKDDVITDYKRKLDGASPDEAKDRIAALERLVAPLKPRDLTDGQALTITKAIAPFAGSVVEIGYFHGDVVCQSYAERLREVFRGAGWRATLNMVIAPTRRGIGLFVDLKPASPTGAGGSLMTGLTDAGIEFVPREGQFSDDLVCRLFVGPKA
ncbi:hypothetical protein [uncultured Phenylobacterium sp.]|uniref:hypothetical protein n=1 Tax=uncultured Phenylobacterium sp. TaxID=349273 RepID=UPI0025EB9F5F|nr:hypothetical protein [uncultured Phenylobacterium sp.]